MPEPLVTKGIKVLSWKDIKGPTLMPDSTCVAGGTEDAQNKRWDRETQPVAGADTLPDSVTDVLRLPERQKMDSTQLEVMMQQMADMAAEAATKNSFTDFESDFASHKSEVKAHISKQSGSIDLKMKELEKHVLQTGTKGWPRAKSTSGSDISTSAGAPVTAPAASEAPKKKTWKPSFIYIQGFFFLPTP